MSGRKKVQQKRSNSIWLVTDVDVERRVVGLNLPHEVDDEEVSVVLGHARVDQVPSLVRPDFILSFRNGF